MRVPDDVRAVLGALVRGRAAGRAFFAGAAFGEAAAAGAAGFAVDEGADPRRRVGGGTALLAAAVRAGAVAGVAFAGAAFAADFADVALAGLRLIGVVFTVADPPDPISARRASSAATDADALVTWRCRRTSSARASLRSRSALAIARSRRACSRLRAFGPELSAAAEAAFEERACFAMVPPVMSTAGSIAEP